MVIRMYCNNGPMVLASGSPRRKKYLEEMGLEFDVVEANIKEECQKGEHPDDFVRRMATEKGLAVSHDQRQSWVVSGDTVVCHDNNILGKPRSKGDAVSILMQLSGREHIVKTGICVCHGISEIVETRVVSTKVVFSNFSLDIARNYVATGEPFDKAGAYGIQGKGAVLVKYIEGSYSNVVGLPLFEIMDLLQKTGAVRVL